MASPPPGMVISALPVSGTMRDSVGPASSPPISLVPLIRYLLTLRSGIEQMSSNPSFNPSSLCIKAVCAPRRYRSARRRYLDFGAEVEGHPLLLQEPVQLPGAGHRLGAGVAGHDHGADRVAEARCLDRGPSLQMAEHKARKETVAPAQPLDEGDGDPGHVGPAVS